MDFNTKLPKVKNKIVLVVMMDILTKYCHIGTLLIDYSLASVVEFFMENIIKLQGMPQFVVSDRDKIHRLIGMALHASSAYHPHSDGQIEVTN